MAIRIIVADSSAKVSAISRGEKESGHSARN